MQVINQIENFQNNSSRKSILTIGNFDGVHCGHRQLLKQMLQLANGEAQTTVLTFSNHPSTVLRPHNPTLSLCTLEHRLSLMKQLGIENIIVLPFTKEFATQNAATFISHLRQYVNFSHLILGYDATLGKDRQGDRAVMKTLGQELGFEVYYLEEVQQAGESVSSTRIRKTIMNGDFLNAALLLQRPYSIYGKVIRGFGNGHKMGFATANLDIGTLCLPPQGVYAVEVKQAEKKYDGIANLGLAPTLQRRQTPILEVHIFDQKQNFYETYLEIIFKKFIRAERKFNSKEELQKQITEDINLLKQ